MGETRKPTTRKMPSRNSWYMSHVVARALQVSDGEAVHGRDDLAVVGADIRDGRQVVHHPLVVVAVIDRHLHPLEAPLGDGPHAERPAGHVLQHEGQVRGVVKALS
eukprot:330137-Prorocentrum_lima.AAC.1